MTISTVFGLFVEFSFETMSDKSQSEKFKKALSTLNDNQLLVLSILMEITLKISLKTVSKEEELSTSFREILIS